MSAVFLAALLMEIRRKQSLGRDYFEDRIERALEKGRITAVEYATCMDKIDETFGEAGNESET